MARSLSAALDRAIRSENADPQGLPADILAAMEADIRANRDRYPAVNAALDRIEAERAGHQDCVTNVTHGPSYPV
jgi:hypothetical protein